VEPELKSSLLEGAVDGEGNDSFVVDNQSQNRSLADVFKILLCLEEYFENLRLSQDHKEVDLSTGPIFKADTKDWVISAEIVRSRAESVGETATLNKGLTCTEFAFSFFRHLRTRAGLLNTNLRKSFSVSKNLELLREETKNVGSIGTFTTWDQNYFVEIITAERMNRLTGRAKSAEQRTSTSYINQLYGFFTIKGEGDAEGFSVAIWENPVPNMASYGKGIAVRSGKIMRIAAMPGRKNRLLIEELPRMRQKLYSTAFRRYRNTILDIITEDVKFLMDQKETSYSIFLCADLDKDRNSAASMLSSSQPGTEVSERESRDPHIVIASYPELPYQSIYSDVEGLPAFSSMNPKFFGAYALDTLRDFL
jgi:hypothetical protein